METFYYLLFAVTETQPPYTKPEIADEIVRMFKMIDQVWVCTDTDRRRSLLGYYYKLFKLRELMGQTYMLPQIPFIRTRLHLRQHDVIWMKVCDELGWTWKQTEIAYANQAVKRRQGAYKRKSKGNTEI